MRLIRRPLALVVILLFSSVMLATAAEPGRKMLSGHVPKALAQLKAQGVLPATNRLSLAIGLPVRDPAGLDAYLQELYDRHSPNYHHYLTPEEFTARFGPTAADYDAVKEFARTNGFTITATHGNRLLLDVAGSVSAVEKTFQVTLRTYRHPKESRNFFAPDMEPSVSAQLPIADISGLDNYSRPHPNFQFRPTQVAPRLGSGSGGAYLGNDFRAAYAPGTTLTGAGQTVGLVQFDGFYAADITNYATAAGITAPPIQTVLIDGFSGASTGGNGNTEVSLDIEMVMAMAPGLSKIVVFEGNPNNFIPNDVLNQMAANNTVKNLSSSWGWSGGPSTTTDTIFKQMAAQGQSYFSASGDSDAFPSSYVDNAGNVTAPASSPYITQVGGTTLSTSSAGGQYTSETVWNWGYVSSAGAYVGSSGGVSSYYSLPTWQQGINSFANNGGSTTKRNIPDVALTGDNVFVYYGNGSSTVVG
ncbi:MAG TPA: protease pro-enzyme activation domain-containing protein, partial [Verrucomicrobiae bacterium]